MKSTVVKPCTQAPSKAAKASGLSPDKVKARALNASASSRSPPVADVRKSFGFMPADIQGVVIHWPPL
jgi:hypothetical protein